MGISSKFPCGGGDGATHSSVLACHGFTVALRPAKILHTKFTAKMIWEKPRRMALKGPGTSER